MRDAWLWRWWLAAGVVAIAGYLMLPVGRVANSYFDAVAVASTIAILAGIYLHRPARPGMWYFIAAGQFASVTGDITYEIYKYVLHQEPFPSVADVFYLSSYVLTGTGLLLLVRSRRGTLGELIDASIAATGVGMVLIVFVLHPIAAGSATSMLARMVATTYPCADLVLLALLARLLTDHAGRTPSIRLMLTSTATLFVGDTAFSLTALYGRDDVHVVDALFLTAYLLWGAAALHPSMAQQSAATEPMAGTVVGPRRLVFFAVCSLFAPALLLLPRVAENTIDRIAVAGGAALLFLFAIIRMSGFVGKVQRQSAELQRTALRDELTGLANRRRFEQALVEAAGGPHQVAFLGLNGFKNVNNELGRSIGDRVLVRLARRLARTVPGAVVARMGGDEFAVLLTDATAPDAAKVADALVGALRIPIEAGGHELLVAVAIGVTAGAGAEPVEVLRRAEAAMYAAKLTGEPVRFWSAALDERASTHARLGAEIRTALDGNQFRVVYQPIVDIETGQVAAVEALVRWEHPERGMVSPAMFVPVAEQNGLIVELGEWVLRTACARLAAWHAELGVDAPSRVSVNVSARQLSRPGFADTVVAALAEAGLPASRLTVEVTETAVFEGGQAVTALHELRGHGVRVALDDFGTGHSSLTLLQTVPVDTLKVDKSFVDGITEAGSEAVIAEALMHVCTGLGLHAVAEGVETGAQAMALRQRGYRLLQGYHFGRPVADPDFDVVRATVAATVATMAR